MRNLNFYGALGLSTLSGCLWFLAVTPFDFSFLAWFAAVPMLLAIEKAGSYRRALFLGWWAGVVETGGGVYLLIDVLARVAGFPVRRRGSGFPAVLRGPRHYFSVVHRRRLRHPQARTSADDDSRAHRHGEQRTARPAIVSLRAMDQPGLESAGDSDQRIDRAAGRYGAADAGEWRIVRPVAGFTRGTPSGAGGRRAAVRRADFRRR